MIVNTKNRLGRLAFLFGRQSGLRSSSDAIDQLQGQLAAERAKVAALNREVASLIHEMAKMQLELATRNTADAFAATPCPSATVH